MLKKDTLIVSCDLPAGSPFNDPLFIRAFAQAAKLGGAAALQIEGIANIIAVRKDQDLPLIGYIRYDESPDSVYITPELSDIEDIIQAGADMVAFDATLRKRPVAISELIDFIHQREKLAIANISTAIEAIAALDAGADFISTGLSGVTSYSPKLEGPDLDLIADLALHGIEVLAEGRIRTPAEAREALSRGAFAVIVGSAITNPEQITSWFHEHMTQPFLISDPIASESEPLPTPQKVEKIDPYVQIDTLEVLEDLQTAKSN